MILHTNGLEYDDRIRKEMLTIKSLYPDVYFKIFAIIDSKQGKSEEGTTDYGIDYSIPFLKTRIKYKPATHLFEKAWDFYRTVSPQLKSFDAIWCADFDVVFFILLSRKRKVWDMHELPELFLGSSLKKLMLKYMMSRCKVVVHANDYRLNYLRETQALSNESNQVVIRNYPNFEEGLSEMDDTLNMFKDWKKGAHCVYLQGLNGRTRSAIEAVSAVMMIENCKGVVVGGYPEDCKKELYEKYGSSLDDRIFFTGLVPQQMTPNYIKECSASLVLYQNSSPNNYYCEPNRMYQSIMNDCPVVVGCNPPMKDLVQKYGFGKVLSDDGRNIESISANLEFIINNRENIRKNIKKHKGNISWNQQVSIFHLIIKKLFD